MTPERYPCLHCGNLYGAAADFSALPRVTSDSKPFRTGGVIGRCNACGMVQKPVTETFLADIGEVYGAYSMFSQASELSEQALFSATGEGSVARSGAVIDCLQKQVRLPENGKMLDVGSGTGPFLGAFGRGLPAWQLFAQDLDDRYQAHLSRLPNFQKIYVGALEALTDTFDVIGLSHSLEHFMEPVATLKLLAGRLNPQGVIIVQVPDLDENVFDLAVCDHRSHFTAASLAQVGKAAGFASGNVRVWRGIVPKQLTMIMSREDVWKGTGAPSYAALPYDLQQGINTLQDYEVEYKLFTAAHEKIAIFGVATAATWFASISRKNLAYFVDEDKSRIGSQHLGVPVVGAQDLPKSIPVFVRLAPTAVEEAICARLAAQGIKTFGSPQRAKVCA